MPAGVVFFNRVSRNVQKTQQHVLPAYFAVALVTQQFYISYRVIAVQPNHANGCTGFSLTG